MPINAKLAGVVRVPLFDYGAAGSDTGSGGFNQWSTDAVISRTSTPGVAPLPTDVRVTRLAVAGQSLMTRGPSTGGLLNSAYINGQWAYIGGTQTLTLSVYNFPLDTGTVQLPGPALRTVKNWGSFPTAVQGPGNYPGGIAMVGWTPVAKNGGGTALWQTIRYADGNEASGMRIDISNSSFLPGIVTPINYMERNSIGEIVNYSWMPSDQPRGSLFEFIQSPFVLPPASLPPSDFDNALRGTRYQGLFFDDPVLDAAFLAGVPSTAARGGFGMVFSTVPQNANQTFTFVIFDALMTNYWRIVFVPKTVSAANLLKLPGKSTVSGKQDSQGVFYLRLNNTFLSSFVPDLAWDPSILPIPRATFGLPCFDPCIDDYWSDPHG